MKTSAIKDLMYGGILELMHNPEYYYNSGVGSRYSHFTDSGKEATCAFLLVMSEYMLIAEEDLLDKRAKELVIKGLKGEKV